MKRKIIKKRNGIANEKKHDSVLDNQFTPLSLAAITLTRLQPVERLRIKSVDMRDSVISKR